MTNRSPYTGKAMELKKEKATLNFRKEPFEIVFHSYYCDESKESFEDDSLSGINYQQVVDQYREKHNIPFPEQIKAIREGYGLSARRMSDILGLGTNSWRLYESGEVPTIANARLIQLISDPENFLKHIVEFGSCDLKEIEKIKHHIETCRQPAEQQNMLLNLFHVVQPNRTSGYSVFSKEKTEQLVYFFAEKLKPYKTAMNKLLFYSDFLHFKQNGRSITGLRYAAIDFGPVPDHFSSLYEMLAEDGVLSVSGNMTDYGYTEKFVVPEGTKPDLSVFSDKELDSIQKVYDTLKGKTTTEIVELSHAEEAWIQYKSTKSHIPYQAAFSITGVK